MVLLTDNLSQASEFGFSAPGKGSGNKEIEIALSEMDKSSSYLATLELIVLSDGRVKVSYSQSLHPGELVDYNMMNT